MSPKADRIGTFVIAIAILVLAIAGVVGAIQKGEQRTAENAKQTAIINCKAEAYDNLKYIEGLGLRRWEAACLRSMPVGSTAKELDKACMIKLEECK